MYLDFITLSEQTVPSKNVGLCDGICYAEAGEKASIVTVIAKKGDRREGHH